MDIWVALILVTFGLLFLALEVLVFPGIGISGVLGFLSLSGGVLIAFVLDLHTGLYVLSGSLVIVFGLLYLSIKNDAFSRMALDAQIDSKVEVNHLDVLKVGDDGITISRLAPIGKVQFGEFYSEVSSWDGFINENTRVKIKKIKDNTIFVSPLINNTL